MKSLSEAYASYVVRTIFNQILQEVIDEIGVDEFKKTSMFLSNERKAND